MVVTIEDGVATIVFANASKRLRGIGLLLDVAGDPQLVKKVTLPELAYIVPEWVAHAAGMVAPLPIKPPKAPVTVSPVPATEPTVEAAPIPPQRGYDDGKPDMDWSRSAMDTYAANLGLNPRHYHNKTAVLEAIRAAEA